MKKETLPPRQNFSSKQARSFGSGSITLPIQETRNRSPSLRMTELFDPTYPLSPLCL